MQLVFLICVFASTLLLFNRVGAQPFNDVVSNYSGNGYCNGNQVGDQKGNQTAALCRAFCESTSNCIAYSFASADVLYSPDGTHCMIYSSCGSLSTYLASLWTTYMLACPFAGQGTGYCDNTYQLGQFKVGWDQRMCNQQCLQTSGCVSFSFSSTDFLYSTDGTDCMIYSACPDRSSYLSTLWTSYALGKNTCVSPCGNIIAPQFGTLGNCSTSIDSGVNCTFACNTGYSLTGPAVMSCYNGHLSTPLQTCSMIQPVSFTYSLAATAVDFTQGVVCTNMNGGNNGVAVNPATHDVFYNCDSPGTLSVAENGDFGSSHGATLISSMDVYTAYMAIDPSTNNLYAAVGAGGLFRFVKTAPLTWTTYQLMDNCGRGGVAVYGAYVWEACFGGNKVDRASLTATGLGSETTVLACSLPTSFAIDSLGNILCNDASGGGLIGFNSATSYASSTTIASIPGCTLNGLNNLVVDSSDLVVYFCLGLSHPPYIGAAIRTNTNPLTYTSSVIFNQSCTYSTINNARLILDGKDNVLFTCNNTIFKLGKNSSAVSTFPASPPSWYALSNVTSVLNNPSNMAYDNGTLYVFTYSGLQKYVPLCPTNFYLDLTHGYCASCTSGSTPNMNNRTSCN